MLNGKDRSDVQRRRNWNAAIEPTDDRRPIVTPYREQTSGLEIIRKLPQIGGGDANNVEPRQGRESDLEGGWTERIATVRRLLLDQPSINVGLEISVRLAARHLRSRGDIAKGCAAAGPRYQRFEHADPSRYPV